MTFFSHKKLLPHYINRNRSLVQLLHFMLTRTVAFSSSPWEEPHSCLARQWWDSSHHCHMSWSTLYNLYCIHLFSSSALRDLGDDRDGEEFTNVTLAYEDGRQAEAHKVVLSLSNPCICQIILGFVPELFLHLLRNYSSICFEITLRFAMHIKQK